MNDSPFTSPPLEEADADFWRWARRIWHFFRGHPVVECYHILGDGGLEPDAFYAETIQCEGCGKEGKRL